MDKFKVTDPNGIYHDGILVEAGKTLKISKGAARNAFLHFKQIEPVAEKSAKDEDPDADAKAKEEADAKAKADADAKKSGGK